MSRKPPKKPFRSIFPPALLRSESPREYAIHRKKIFQQFCPRVYLEEYLLDQYVKSSWEVMRNHRFGPEIINGAYTVGLQNILALGSQLYGMDTDHLAQRFFSDVNCNRQAVERLAKTGLDEAAVEAEAYRLRAPSLEAHEKLASAAEKRSNRMLQDFLDYRAGVATPVCRTLSQPASIDNDEPASD